MKPNTKHVNEMNLAEVEAELAEGIQKRSSVPFVKRFAFENGMAELTRLRPKQVKRFAFENRMAELTDRQRRLKWTEKAIAQTTGKDGR